MSNSIEVLEQLDSACRYLFPDRAPHKAFDMAKALIESLQRRVTVLETVIYEDLPLDECSDGLNLMIVEGIIKQKEAARMDMSPEEWEREKAIAEGLNALGQ